MISLAIREMQLKTTMRIKVYKAVRETYRYSILNLLSTPNKEVQWFLTEINEINIIPLLSSICGV